MRWSIRLGRAVGIAISVHVTFPLLLAWAVISQVSEGHQWDRVLAEIAFIMVVFGIVVIHELGHALAAQRSGIRTRDIILLLIGGVARLERMPDQPRQELVVALAGPAVNFVLAAGLYTGAAMAGQFIEVSGSMFRGTLLRRLFWVNVLLAVFNLRPAFPRDGGRGLRAILAMRMDFVRATPVAAHIGQGIAYFFGFVGLFISPCPKPKSGSECPDPPQHREPWCRTETHADHAGHEHHPTASIQRGAGTSPHPDLTTMLKTLG